MIRIFFGSPGCGKTTYAAKLAYKLRHKRKCYLNFEHQIPGAAVCTLDNLGEWTFPDGSYILIDEAGIEYNNRKFKSLPQHTIAWFKKHRHYRCDVDVFSQSWEDMDVTIRRLADELWYMKKIGPWTLCRRVFQRVMVDENTHQIIDGYKLAHMAWLLFWPLLCILFWPFMVGKRPFLRPKFKLTFRPFYYRFFDSWSKDNLYVRIFPVPRPLKKKKSLG